MGKWSDRVHYQGRAVNLGLRYQIEAANKMLASRANGGERGPLTIVQGSWSGSVSASAGTHSGSGALDITAFNWRNRERVFRLLGVAMWHRPALRGVWAEHMHGISDGDGGVSRGAAAQIRAYHNRRNGLANNGPDKGYRMHVFPMFVFPEKPHGKPGKCWVSTGGKTFEQPTPVSPPKRVLKVGDTFDVVAVVNVNGTYWGINADAECFPMVNLSRTPLGGGPAPTPTTNIPAKLLDLKSWKLTTPLGKNGKPIEIRQPALGRYADARCFFVRGNAVVFRVPVDGVTTSGSSYPRSELREMTSDGSDEAAWSTTSSKTHGVRGVFAVTRLPGKKPAVVVAQIHDKDDDVVLLLVEGTKVSASWSKGKGKGSEKVLLMSGLALGQKVKFEVSSVGGVVTVKADGHKSSKAKRKSGCYLKAGAYSQANEDNGSGAGEVEFYALEKL